LSYVNGISVVIPNYNGENLLPEILPALYSSIKEVNLPYEVIISDDKSTDGSLAYLQKNNPDIIVIESQINSGFSVTINKGINAAKYNVILLLNSDVKLTQGFFKNQLRYFDLPDTFGVMSRIIGWDDEEIQDGGKYPGFHGVKIKTSGNYIPVNTTNNNNLYSMYLSGANALVSAEKIKHIGGFDEIFSPFYVEDFELSLRAWRLGWKCYYEHNAVCRHKTSTTIKTKSSKIFVRKIYNRNKMLLHGIHLQPVQKLIWFTQLFFETFVQVILGKLWFFASVKMFLAKAAAVKKSKEKLVALAQKNPLVTENLNAAGIVKIK
jgi:GT2 family glycosyltransferase